jgi:hypothetical protein
MLTGIASVVGILLGGKQRQALEFELQLEKAKHESEMRDKEEEGRTKLVELQQQHDSQMREREQKAKEELADKEREFQGVMKALDRQRLADSEAASLSRQDRHILLEKARLQQTTDASQLEIEVTAIRLAREQGVQFANLVHVFFERLTSPNAGHRKLALFALQDFFEDSEDFERFLTEKFAAKPTDGATPTASATALPETQKVPAGPQLTAGSPAVSRRPDGGPV